MNSEFFWFIISSIVVLSSSSLKNPISVSLVLSASLSYLDFISYLISKKRSKYFLVWGMIPVFFGLIPAAGVLVSSYVVVSFTFMVFYDDCFWIYLLLSIDPNWSFISYSETKFFRRLSISSMSFSCSQFFSILNSSGKLSSLFNYFDSSWAMSWFICFGTSFSYVFYNSFLLFKLELNLLTCDFLLLSSSDSSEPIPWLEPPIDPFLFFWVCLSGSSIGVLYVMIFS